jgi:pyruvate dehydrogenase E1 component beta subunit
VQLQAFDYLDAPIVRVSGRDVSMPYALNLEESVLVSEADVLRAVKKVLYVE